MPLFYSCPEEAKKSKKMMKKRVSFRGQKMTPNNGFTLPPDRRTDASMKMSIKGRRKTSFSSVVDVVKPTLYPVVKMFAWALKWS